MINRINHIKGLGIFEDYKPGNNNFIIANMGRRLLESFNAFKTPSTNGFNAILDSAVNKGVLEEDAKERIYYFVNKYSHLDRIESHENILENIESEGVKVSSLILELIKGLDEDHYNSMMKLCQ